MAWKPLGFKPLGFADINPFASAVLAHHYPETKNYGDITQHASWNIQPGTVDLLIGGSPCQAFSIGGYREGLADPRGNLTLTLVSLIDRLRPRYFIWENVEGVLNSNGGRDFAAFIWALAQCGYSFGWRVLDAKGTGSPKPLPQRRRRVFLVAHLTDREAAAQILFKPEGLPGHLGQSCEEGKDPSPPTASSVASSGTGRLKHFRKSSRPVCKDGFETWVECPFTNTMNLFDVGDIRSTSAVVDEAVLYENHAQDSRITPCPIVAPTVVAKYGTGGGNTPLVRSDLVRRLTCVEVERLQGFPDNYTKIPWKGKHPDNCPDNLRMIALGNSMAVPVIRLLGERIKAYEETKNKKQ